MKEKKNVMRKVFLSYIFLDREKMCFIIESLRKRGFEVISDVGFSKENEIMTNSFDKINECSCVIIVISENTNRWGIKEFEIVSKKNKKVFLYIKGDIYVGELKNRFKNRIIGLWNDENELAEKIIDDVSRYEYMHPQRAYEFELFVNEIFISYGCFTEMTTRDMSYDLIAEKNGMKFYIESKAVRQKVIGSESVSKAIVASQMIEQTGNNSKFVLVVANKISEQMQMAIKKSESMIAIDIHNLLYLVQDNETLKSKLLSLLEFSIDEIEPREPTALIELLGTIDYEIDEKTIIKGLIGEIHNWDSKIRTSYEYEHLCMRVLNSLFAADLGLWKDQQRSNEDLFRFDLICKIKDDIQEAFWKFIEKYFKSKYIIFEFKNYTDQITQKEIYTTDKYLYAKALRCVAIIISCNGEDKNAQKAIRGTLRENGKLILSISNRDMITMLEGKLKDISPAEYLYSKLDTMLVELDK